MKSLKKDTKTAVGRFYHDYLTAKTCTKSGARYRSRSHVSSGATPSGRMETSSDRRPPLGSKPVALRTPLEHEKIEGDFYEIEQIFDHRVVDKKDARTKDGRKKTNQYLVKWKGYPVEEATWEPTSHFSPEAIEEFYQMKIEALRKLLSRLL
ncbi:unnamed protein product [Calypogeia fissa]